MKYHYSPKNNLEKFGIKVYNLLVENFPQTFFVGGMVRDLLLNKKVTDIDMATIAQPDDIKNLLSGNNIQSENKNQKYGAIIAKEGTHCVEITTFRKDLKATSRYPEVKFIRSVEIDSNRRDFTINSLYLSVKNSNILDFHNGITDIKKRLIRFIGDPVKKIQEDPLRILRALRFSLVLDFKLEKNTFKTVKNNLNLADSLTQTKILKEVGKLKNQEQEKLIKNLLIDKDLLDKYFK